MDTTTTTSELVYVGSGNNYVAYRLDMNRNLSTASQAETYINEIGYKLGYTISVKEVSIWNGGMLVSEIGYKMGYRIMIAEVYSGKNGITIDFDPDSAPFDTVNTYWGNGTEEYRTYSAEIRPIRSLTVSERLCSNTTEHLYRFGLSATMCIMIRNMPSRNEWEERRLACPEYKKAAVQMTNMEK